MLLVKTKIAVSKIAGVGLFADQFIPKGTMIWKFYKNFDMRAGKDYPETLPEPAKTFFKTYAYQNPKTLNWVLCSDNAKFWNHSDTPNTHCVKIPDDEDTADVASRDIQAGEELTVNYREFDKNPLFGFELQN